MSMDAAVYDLNKAFDCISHEKLLINAYDIIISPLKNICPWLCDFLITFTC